MTYKLKKYKQNLNKINNLNITQKMIIKNMKKLVKPKLDIWKLIKLIQDANKKSTSVESKKA